MRDGIDTLCDWLGKGVRLVSVTQQLDFAGPAGKMIASVLFAVAEMEQQTRRERQAAGIAVAKRNGVYQGRKPQGGCRPRSCVAKQGLERYGDCNSPGSGAPNRATLLARIGKGQGLPGHADLARTGGREGPLFGRIPYDRKNLRGRVALSTGLLPEFEPRHPPDSRLSIAYSLTSCRLRSLSPTGRAVG